jgi:hypothetical protein
MTNMKQQTSVDFIIDELTSKNLLGIFTYEQYKQVEEIFEKGKEMEKEKLEDAWVEGVKNWNPSKTFEQYYEQTYGGNK